MVSEMATAPWRSPAEEPLTELEIRQALRGVLDHFGQNLAGVRVVLFGSRARGAARPRSDFDIGLLGPGPVSATLIARIQDKLEALPTLVRFDLVDLGRASPAFRQAVLAHAEVLLE
jgi:predicted nucleotidyltransferase